MAKFNKKDAALTYAIQYVTEVIENRGFDEEEMYKIIDLFSSAKTIKELVSLTESYNCKSDKVEQFYKAML